MDAREFEIRYVNLIEKRNLLQWENYAFNQDHDLNSVNNKIYEFLQQTVNKVTLTGRKKDVFYKIYLKNIVENCHQIAEKRNRLDNWDNYEDEYSRKISDYSNHRIELAKRMREDVLELMKLRNTEAKKLGFNSYPELIFFVEELDQSEILRLVEDFLDNNTNQARNLIRKFNLSWKDWFTRLREIGEYQEATIVDPISKVTTFFEKLGLGDTQRKIAFTFKKQKISGMAIGISIPDDVRILMRPVDSIMGLTTLFHECGHAVTYALNGEKGFYTILTTSYDEIMATIFENIGIEICMTDEEKKKAREIKLLESIRCSISFLFEMELWRSPGHAEMLFQKYQSLLPMEPTENILWAIDSFRSIDPVYIQNYILGEIYAQKVIKNLRETCGEDFIKWGNKLKEKFLIDGMERSFVEKYTAFMAK